MKIRGLYIYAFLACISCLCILVSCSNTKKEQPNLVQEELDRRLEKYRKTLINKCKAKATDRAIAYTDSIVAELMSNYVGDTLRFPAKPTRPNPPERIKLDDTTVIKPIIEQ